jgi:hypothetical protein
MIVSSCKMVKNEQFAPDSPHTAFWDSPIVNVILQWVFVMGSSDQDNTVSLAFRGNRRCRPAASGAEDRQAGKL